MMKELSKAYLLPEIEPPEPPRDTYPWWGAYVWLVVCAFSFAFWAVLFKLVWWIIQ